MRTYCKAYHLRQFACWVESPSTGEPTLQDESIVYLWDDFTVAGSPILHDSVIFANNSPQWQAFCAESLHFVIPLIFSHEPRLKPPRSVSPASSFVVL